MQLRSPTGEAYSVTADDALWLARAVEAEGPVQSHVAAVLLNGFTWARSRNYKGTLTQWIRAYAQPVNPRWYPDGDLFKADCVRLKLTGDALTKAIAHADKRRTVHSVRVKFSEGTQKAVADALNGRVQIPRNATDYAAPTLDASKKGYTALEPVPKGRNRLWARPGAEKWAGYMPDATDAWPWLTVAALVGGVVIWKVIA